MGMSAFFLGSLASLASLAASLEFASSRRMARRPPQRRARARRFVFLPVLEPFFPAPRSPQASGDDARGAS